MNRMLSLAKLCEILPFILAPVEKNGYCTEKAKDCKYCEVTMDKYFCKKKLFNDELEINFSKT